MSLLKKRIAFPQFLADLITRQCDFLAANRDKLIGMADELKVLTSEDKELFIEKTHALLMADIAVRCSQYLSPNVSSEEVGRGVSTVYATYLTQYKHISKTLAEQKVESVLTLFDLMEKAEKEVATKNEHYESIGLESPPNIVDDPNAAQYYLCSGFAEYCAGEDVKAPDWQGRHLAAFRLAKALVTADVVGCALRECRVTF